MLRTGEPPAAKSYVRTSYWPAPQVPAVRYQYARRSNPAEDPHSTVTIAASAVNVNGWAHCLMKEPTPLEAFRGLQVPVLYMTGSDSPASAKGVARILARALPQVEVVEFKGLGHMGPVTHPDSSRCCCGRSVR